MILSVVEGYLVKRLYFLVEVLDGNKKNQAKPDNGILSSTKQNRWPCSPLKNEFIQMFKPRDRLSPGQLMMQTIMGQSGSPALSGGQMARISRRIMPIWAKSSSTGASAQLLSVQ